MNLLAYAKYGNHYKRLNKVPIHTKGAHKSSGKVTTKPSNKQHMC
jgi:hypothetical protein